MRTRKRPLYFGGGPCGCTEVIGRSGSICAGRASQGGGRTRSATKSRSADRDVRLKFDAFRSFIEFVVGLVREPRKEKTEWKRQSPGSRHAMGTRRCVSPSSSMAGTVPRANLRSRGGGYEFNGQIVRSIRRRYSRGSLSFAKTAVSPAISKGGGILRHRESRTMLSILCLGGRAGAVSARRTYPFGFRSSSIVRRARNAATQNAIDEILGRSRQLQARWRQQK